MRKPTLIFIFISSWIWNGAAQSLSTSELLSATKFEGEAAPPKKPAKKKAPQRASPQISSSHKEQSENIIEKGFLKGSDKAAETVDKISDKIDIFLAGGKTTNKKTKSRLIVRNEAYAVEGQKPIKHKTRFDLRLNLQNLEEKWTVNFSSYDDDEEERGISRNRLRTEPRRDDYGASVMLLKKLGDYDFTFRPKLTMNHRHLMTSHLMRLESEADMGRYRLLPKLELFAKADKGTGELIAINFEYDFNKIWLGALTNEEEYVDYQNKFSTNHEIALQQTLNSAQILKYAVLFESSNRQDFGEETKTNFHLIQLSFYVMFRHKLYRDRLHYSLSPRLIFPESNNYTHRGVFVASLDFIF